MATKRIEANLAATDRICSERGYSFTRRAILRGLMTNGWGDFRLTDERIGRNNLATIQASKRADYCVEVRFGKRGVRYHAVSLRAPD